MTETGITLTVGILCFVAGLLLGALIHRLMQSETAKNRRLVQQLDQLKEQHTRYQAEVSEHFAKTADIYAKLNTNYRELLAHMANSAERLSDDVDFSRTLNLTGPSQRPVHVTEFEPDADDFEPPRDYAPKATPHDKGTLSEDFGLDTQSKS